MYKATVRKWYLVSVWIAVAATLMMLGALLMFHPAPKWLVRGLALGLATVIVLLLFDRDVRRSRI
jgi:hypothetical protein